MYLCTCTIPHDGSDDLKLMRKAISAAWRFVQQGQRWVDLKARLGVVGSIRGDDEPTWGMRGWHPHFHVLIVTERPLNAEHRQELWEHIYGRWSARIQLYGYRRPSADRGIHLTVSSQADYITKLGLADELASGLYKEAHEGRITPTQLLVRAQKGDRSALARYREYREAYHGVRKLTYSRGLRERYAMPEERTDEEVAASEEMPVGGKPFEYVFDDHDRSLWNRAIVDSPERQAELVACGRGAGVDGVEVYLRCIALGIRLADRLGLSPYASIKEIEARMHDPPRMAA